MSLLDELDARGASSIDGYLSPADFIALYRSLRPSEVAFDTEAPTYKWHLPWCIPFAMTFSWSHEHTYYVPCALNGVMDQEAAEVLYEVLGTTPTIICHNAKFDLHIAKRLFDPFGIPLVSRRVEDTMILDAVLDENRHHGLKERCTDLGITYDPSQNADELKEQIGAWIQAKSQAEHREVGYDEVPARLMVPYARQDAYLTLELYRYLRTDMDEQQSGRVFARDLRDIYKLELDVLWVLFQMEERGMRVDMDFVMDQIAELTPQLEHTRTKLTDALGFEINPGSTDDVAKALQILGHEDALWVNPKTGKVNLPEWRMEELAKDPTAGELVRDVLSYRSNAKMLNSYYETLQQESAEDETGQWIVRCNNKQLGARTGRMSVTEPALQTIPRKKGSKVRGAFIAREGHKLIFADYSQQELRVLAHYMFTVKDGSMKIIFEQGEVDLHQETAAAIFQTPYDAVTKSERDDGKQTNFAIVYGAGVKKIASMHGVDEQTAKARLNRLYTRFPGLQALKRTCETLMRQRGFVVTAFGRRHREKEGKFAYKAINSLVQGTSADVTKAAMVRINAAFHEARMQSMVLLSVHDEIITEAPFDEVEAATEIVRRAMLDVPEILVPMDVEIAVANRWSEAK